MNLWISFLEITEVDFKSNTIKNYFNLLVNKTVKIYG
jgi:hypothetical protein